MTKSKKKLTLKEAREKGKLDEFIKEHEKDAPGDADAVDDTINNIATNTRPSPSKATEREANKSKKK